MHTSNKYNPRIDNRGKWFKRRPNKTEDKWDHDRVCMTLAYEVRYHLHKYPGRIILRDPVTHEYIFRDRHTRWFWFAPEPRPEWICCNSCTGEWPNPRRSYRYGAIQKPNGAWQSNRNRSVTDIKNRGNRDIRRAEKREIQRIMAGEKEDFESHCYSNMYWQD